MAVSRTRQSIFGRHPIADFFRPQCSHRQTMSSLRLIEMKNVKTVEQARFLLRRENFNKAKTGNTSSLSSDKQIESRPTKRAKTVEQTLFSLGRSDFNKPATRTPSSAMPRKMQSAGPRLIETKNAKTVEQTRFLLDPTNFNKAATVDNHQHRFDRLSMKQKLRKPWNKAVFVGYQ